MIDTRLPGDLRADGLAFVEAVVNAQVFGVCRIVLSRPLH